MAIAAVKATKGQNNASFSVTFSVDATAGNALVVWGNCYQGNTLSVTRTGDTYTADTSGQGTGADNFAGLASAPNVAGGAVDMTVSGGQNGGLNAIAFEISGLPSSAIRDATSPAIATGTSTAPTSNSLTNATADAIFVGGFTNNSPDVGSTVSPGTGWTMTVGAVTMSQTNGSVNSVGGIEYKIVSSAAAQTADFTADNHPWAAYIAVYKAAGAAANVRPRSLLTLGVGS